MVILAFARVETVNDGPLRSMVKVAETSTEMLPAGSVPWTVKVWVPAARLLKAEGLVQAAKVPLSSLHAKKAVLSGDEKLKEPEA